MLDGKLSHSGDGTDRSALLSLLGRIDRSINQFDEGWRAGRRPRLEDYLTNYFEGERPEVVQALLPVELDYRRRRGELPTLPEYEKRLPDLVEAIRAVFDAEDRTPHGPDGTPEDERSTGSRGSSTSRMPPFLTLNSRFRILRDQPHAEGGLGEVFLASDECLHREVALKVIKDRGADEPDNLDYQERFVREAEITGRIDHPGVVPVYGLGRDDKGRPFYAMRFIKDDGESGSLRDAIERFHRADKPGWDPGKRALMLRQLLGRFQDVCNTVTYAHSQNVVHRDLKPANILLGAFGETFVVDWGLAKMLEGPKDEEGSGANRSPSRAESFSTWEGMRGGGTPQYMSPEQAAGDAERLGPATDVYSLGATLYHLLTGRAPFKGPIAVVLELAQRGEFPGPRRLKPSIPPALEAICLKAMAKEPGDRYPSPRALAADIERWLADEPVQVYRERLGQRLARWTRRHRTWVQAGGAALLLLSVVSVVAALLIDAARRRADSALNQADSALNQAREARRRADSALNQERIALHDKRTLTTRLALDRSLALCNQGDTDRGLLWMARSLKEAPDDEGDLIRVIRTNLDGWRRQRHLLRNRLEHRGAVEAVAFSPDGKTALTASDDGTVRLWSTATGEPVGKPLVHQSEVKVVAFSPDGRTLLTGGWEWDTARLWNVASGVPIGKPLTHQGEIVAVAFSPDGKTALTASNDGTVGLWDPSNGRPIGEPLHHPGEVTTAVFSPDGNKILTGTMDHTAWLWEKVDGEFVGFSLPHRSRVAAVAFSPDGETVLTGASDLFNIKGTGEARLWDAVTGQPFGEPMRHDGSIDAVAFSPDGSVVLTGSGDKTARLWDASTGQPIGSPMTHQGAVRAAVFSPDGEFILTGSSDKTARLWDASDGHPVGAPLSHHEEVRGVAFSPDGKTILTGCGYFSKGEARLWSTADEESFGTPLVRNSPVTSVAFSPNGQLAFAGGWVGTTQLWDVTGGYSVATPIPHQSCVMDAAFSPDGKTILTTSISLDHAARLWDAATHKVVGSPLRHRGGVTSVAFSPDSKTILTGSADNVAQLWDAVRRVPIGPPLTHEDRVQAVAFSPDGKTVLTGSADGIARLWDASEGRPIGVPMEHRGAVTSVAFSPDGKRILTGSDDYTGRFWDTATGRLVGQPLAHRALVRSVAFSPDGKLALTGSADGTAWLWDAVSGRPVGEPIKLGRDVEAVAFSPDGKSFLIAGSPDFGSPNSLGGVVQLFDSATRMPIGKPLAHQDRVESVTFSPDGKTILTGGRDKTVRSWDAATGRPIGEPMRHGGVVTAVAFSPDGKTVLTGSGGSSSGEYEACLWDTDTGKAIGPPLLHEGIKHGVALGPEGRAIMVSAGSVGDRSAQLWDMVTGKPIGGPLSHQARIDVVAFSPDGKRFATGGGKWMPHGQGMDERGEAQLWDAATGRPIGPLLLHRAAIDIVAFSPDGKTLLTGDGGKAYLSQVREIRFWDAATGRPIGKPIPWPGDCCSAGSVAFSRDSRILLTVTGDRGTDGGEAQLWDISTGQPLGATMPNEGGKVITAAISPDGKIVLTASRDNTAQFWDAATCQPLGPPLRLRAWIRAADFSPDGRTVLIGAGGSISDQAGEARLWMVPQFMEGDADRIILWATVVTGKELDPDGMIHELDMPTWREYRRRLGLQGGDPAN
jgi:WD40 repeat protein/tRNA A-37 threonylcarbamoyl transferase component Bud32